jgi:ribose transport system substrate-binding protein
MRKPGSIGTLGILTLSALVAGCTGNKNKDKGAEKEEAKEAPAAQPEATPPPAEAPPAEATAGADKPAGAQKTIGMSQCNLGEPWRVQMNADVKAAAEKHPELKVIYKDAQNDSLVQRSHVEEFVAQKVDLIIISPKEAAPLTEPVAKAVEAGIPVIVLDRAVLGDKYTTFIGADNVKIGREAGKWVAKTLGGKGAIVELKGLMTSTPGQDRHKGFLEGLDLKANPGLKIVFDADMKWLEPDARREMESALSRQKKIDVVYGHNDPGAHGAYLAAKQAGREKEMKFVGIDALPHEGVQYVKEGILDATFQYPTGGAEAIDTALKIFAGGEAPKKIGLPTRSFTKESIEAGGELIQ